MGQWILTVNIKPDNLDLLFNVITETQFQLGKAYLSLNLCSQRTDLQGIRRTLRKKPNVLLSLWTQPTDTHADAPSANLLGPLLGPHLPDY